MSKSAARQRSEGSRRSRTIPTPAQEARRRQPLEWVDRGQLGTGEGQPVETIWRRAPESKDA